MQPSKKLYYKIGEVAKMLDVSMSTLRYWDGHIKYLHTDRAFRQRRYTPAQIVRLKKVRMLIYRMGFSVAGVDKFLERNGKVHEGEIFGLIDIGGQEIKFDGTPVRIIVEDLGR